jgi:SAM-dependent methyltransferase
MKKLAYSAAAERNRQPILAVLRELFAGTRRVLELGSGTGQHAVFFAAGLPQLSWQPSDLPSALSGLQARIEAEGPPNCLPPVPLDVARPPWAVPRMDGIFSANTLHIVSWPAVRSLFEGVAERLAPGGRLVIYGPFRYAGEFTSPSNAAFDQALRSRDPASGIRDFEAVLELATAQRLRLLADYAMPANNQLLAWQREAEPQ